MENEKYSRRDYLAQDRTRLANERTLLAFWRTALAFLASGAFILKFISSAYFVVPAIFLMLFGAGLFVYGFVRYRKYQKKINSR